jgi:hypothetical protein
MGKRTEWLRAQFLTNDARIDANVDQITLNITDIADLDSDKYDKTGGEISGNTTWTNRTVTAAGTTTVTHSGSGNIQHTSTGKILHSGAGNIEHGGAGKILHSAAGDIEHSSSGDIKHSGTGHIWQAGTGDIKITGAGRFIGKGDQLNTLPLNKRMMLDVYAAVCDNDDGRISTTTTPKLVHIGAGDLGDAIEWDYDDFDVSGKKIFLYLLVPNTYASGAGFAFSGRYIDNGGFITAVDLSVEVATFDTDYGFQGAPGTPLFAAGATGFTASFEKKLAALSGGDFGSGGGEYAALKLWPVNPVAGASGDKFQLLIPYFTWVT